MKANNINNENILDTSSIEWSKEIISGHTGIEKSIIDEMDNVVTSLPSGLSQHISEENSLAHSIANSQNAGFVTTDNLESITEILNDVKSITSLAKKMMLPDKAIVLQDDIGATAEEWEKWTWCSGGDSGTPDLRYEDIFCAPKSASQYKVGGYSRLNTENTGVTLKTVMGRYMQLDKNKEIDEENEV